MPGAAASAAFCQDAPTFVTIIIAARHARRTTMPAFVGASNLSVTRGSTIRTSSASVVEAPVLPTDILRPCPI